MDEKQILNIKCDDSSTKDFIYGTGNDDDEDDDDDVDYVPPLIEEKNPALGKEYYKIHREQEKNLKNNKLSDADIEEIANLWQQMKDIPNYTHPQSSSSKMDNATSSTDSSSHYIKSSATESSNRPHKPPTRPKRHSNIESIIQKHSKFKKESTLCKSKKLWKAYRNEENIGDDLDIQSRNGHLEKSSFLNQAKYNEWKQAQQYRLKYLYKKQDK